jgi:hypothetical protein
MSYETQRVVTDDAVAPADEVVLTDPAPATTERVVRQPQTVVEDVPARRTVVRTDDPVGSALAASQLIQTVVWSVVVLVLLVVALWALHVYAGLW